jgi:hypothetical protein
MRTSPPDAANLVLRAQAVLAEILDAPSGSRQKLPAELTADEIGRVLDALRWTSRRQDDGA